MESGDVNSGLHVYTDSTLSTKSSPSQKGEVPRGHRVPKVTDHVGTELGLSSTLGSALISCILGEAVILHFEP